EERTQAHSSSTQNGKRFPLVGWGGWLRPTPSPIATPTTTIDDPRTIQNADSSAMERPGGGGGRGSSPSSTPTTSSASAPIAGHASNRASTSTSESTPSSNSNGMTRGSCSFREMVTLCDPESTEYSASSAAPERSYSSSRI